MSYEIFGISSGISLCSPETGQHELQTDFSDNLTSVAKQVSQKISVRCTIHT